MVWSLGGERGEERRREEKSRLGDPTYLGATSLGLAMLLLFDIDGTLLVTQGSGMRAMGEAGHELFGARFDETKVKFAGRLDPLIIADLLRHNNLPLSRENMAAMLEGYRRHLVPKLATPGNGRALPGVQELLASLRARTDITLGVLTGNIEETGRLKLKACGIDPDQFVLSVWGDHSPHDPPARSHLPAVGIARYRTMFGREIDPARVSIIGDTPYDAECALANGCRCLGVATGQFSVAQLLESGAHHAVADLTATAEIVSWLVDDARSSK